METIYTKKHCLDWIKNPQIDPITHQLILDNKKQFKILLDKCKIHLSPEEIKQYNINMLSIIYPTTPHEFNTTYHISKLNDKQHHLYEEAVYGNKISKQDILQYINDDQFITSILNNERLFLTKKYEKYLELPNSIQFDKQQSIINDRLALLGNKITFLREVIDKKKTQLLKFLDSLTNLLCESRVFIHQLVYQQIIYFSHPIDQSIIDISMVNLLIGKIGTGRQRLTQLFADLYFSLGILNTNIVKKVLSPLNIECMIYLEHYSTSDLREFIDKFKQLCAINIIVNDVKESQKFVNENRNIKYLFENIIYLRDYSLSDLSSILFKIIKHLYPHTTQLELQQSYISILITENPDLFINQAKDIECLAHYIINDFILISSQEQDYGQQQINDTFKKFFLHKGKYITIRDNKITSTPMYDLTQNMSQILVSNLLTRQQIMTLIQNDVFLKELLQSKQKILTERLLKYQLLCNLIAEDGCNQAVNIIKSHIDHLNTEVTIEKLKCSLNEIINIIDTIKGNSRENIRRTLYSQICIFSKLHSYHCHNFMNYVIIGPNCSNKMIIFDVISKICEQVGFLTRVNNHSVTLDETIQYEQVLEHVQIFETLTAVKENILKYIEIHVGLCGIVMNSDDIQTTVPFNHLFTNYLMLLPYNSHDLLEIMMSEIGENQLLPIQTQYIKNLIELLNKDPDQLFDEQACDMINLAKYIKYDMILFQEHYGVKEIQHSFQKLFYSKGVLINFLDILEEPIESVSQVFQNVKRLRSSYFN